jgi:SHS family lactate transporter-like MFS transporter
MGCWRSIGDGKLADPLARFYERGIAGIVGLGFLLSSAAYGLLYTSIGWRGLLWLGILPALTVVYVRYFVKEPPVWVENRRRQREEKREVRMPLFSIFKRGMIANTLLACWWMAGGLVTYYSINGMFATHLQKDLGLSPAVIATPIIFANLVVFLSSSFWGWAGDRIGPQVGDDHSGIARNSGGILVHAQ